jgi:hypothetical protein
MENTVPPIGVDPGEAPDAPPWPTDAPHVQPRLTVVEGGGASTDERAALYAVPPPGRRQP